MNKISANTNCHAINGEWVQGNGAIFLSTDPATGETVWEGRLGTHEDIQAAYEAAKGALNDWARLEVSSRIDYLQRFAQQVEIKRAQLADIISKETGKPFWESLTEVSAVIGKIALSIQAYQERNGEKHITHPDATACIRYKPHGVIAVLGAFNLPAHLSNGHIIPALLAGNTLIYKPSELAPAVAECIMQCWHDCGIPKGVINCIQGNGETGQHLLTCDIQGVYFTGSFETGVRINQQFSTRPEVILALEMGGNNPLVIDEVFNMEAAIYHTVLSTIITAGQRCSCARRLIIPNTAFGDAFLNRFIETLRTIKIGGYRDNPEPFLGPVISHHQAQSHLIKQSALIQKGAVALTLMTLLKENTGFLSPGVLDMASVDGGVDEEIFAPLVQVYRYHDFDQALQIANNTRYGLAAGLLSDSHSHYQHFYQTINAGLINWNRPTTGAASNLPFGGVGRSGNHRPSAYYATDYCTYPIASLEQPLLTTPAQLLPGIQIGAS